MSTDRAMTKRKADGECEHEQGKGSISAGFIQPVRRKEKIPQSSIFHVFSGILHTARRAVAIDSRSAWQSVSRQPTHTATHPFGDSAVVLVTAGRENALTIGISSRDDDTRRGNCRIPAPRLIPPQTAPFPKTH
ncbi:hypothetical protein VTO42DRAFT_536 [Malbranchea cinnamomea]